MPQTVCPAQHRQGQGAGWMSGNLTVRALRRPAALPDGARSDL